MSATSRQASLASGGRLTSAITWVLVGIGLLALGLAIRALFTAGIGWDAPYDARFSLVNRMIDPSVTLQQAYDTAEVTSEFYGILHFQIAEFLHQAVTGSREWMSPDDPATYAWQNAVTLLYSVVATAVLSVTIARVLGSRLAGAFTWAALLTTPLWLGMSVIDYKDMPVAAGLTLVSAGLMWAWTGRRTRDLILAVAMATLGGIVALGSRAGSLPLVAAIPLATLLMLLLAQVRLRDPRRLLPIAALTVITPVAAALAMWLTNPIARINLLQWLADSFTVVRQYPWIGMIRTAGQDLPSDQLPWWYAPAWLLANLPLLTTALLAFGIVCFAMSALRPSWGVGRGATLTMSPLLIQGILLPIAIIASGAILYDGIRHLLFIFPPLIAFMAVGVATLQREVTQRQIGATAALIVVAASLFAVARWYPYHYAFINPLAGVNKTERQWELDYWGVTAREGVTRLRAVGLNPIAVIPASEPSRPYGGLTVDEVNAIAPPPQRSGIYAFLRWDSRILEQWCGVTFTIARDGHTLGQGGYCPK